MDGRFSHLLDVPAANDNVVATLDVDSDDNLYAGLSYDVASGGVFIATYTPPPVGARVEVMLTMPDGRQITVGGIVRWIRDAELESDGLPAGCAIEWKALPVAAVRYLEAFAALREPLLHLPEAAA